MHPRPFITRTSDASRPRPTGVFAVRLAVGAALIAAFVALSIPAHSQPPPPANQPAPDPAAAGPDVFPEFPDGVPAPTGCAMALFSPGAVDGESTEYTVARVVESLVQQGLESAPFLAVSDMRMVREKMAAIDATETPVNWAPYLAAELGVPIVVGGHVRRVGEVVEWRGWLFDRRVDEAARFVKLAPVTLDLTAREGREWQTMLAIAAELCNAVAARHPAPQAAPQSPGRSITVVPPAPSLAPYAAIVRCNLARARNDFQAAQEHLATADRLAPGLPMTIFTRADMFLEIRSIDPEIIPADVFQQIAAQLAQLLGAPNAVPRQKLMWTYAIIAIGQRDARAAELAILNLIGERPYWFAAWQMLLTQVKPSMLHVRYAERPQAGIAKIIAAARGLVARLPNSTDARLILADALYALGEGDQALAEIKKITDALGTPRAGAFRAEALRSAGYAESAWLRRSRDHGRAADVTARFAETFPADAYAAHELLLAASRHAQLLLDTDDSQFIERGEVPDASAFAACDADRDGKLTLDEFLGYLAGFAQDPLRLGTRFADGNDLVKLADACWRAALVAQAVAGPGQFPRVDRFMSSVPAAERFVEMQRAFGERLTAKLAVDNPAAPSPELIVAALGTWHLAQLLEQLAANAANVQPEQLARFRRDRIRAGDLLARWRIASSYIHRTRDARRDPLARFAADFTAGSGK